MKKLLLATLAVITAFSAFAATPYQFSLQGAQGEVSDSDFADRYVLLTFGYTSCPDICPTTLYEIAQAMKLLDKPEKLQVVFVSIDPHNDTLPRLQQYVGYFDKRIIGLSADYPTLKHMAEAYGASFGYTVGDEKLEPPELPAAYNVYHSTLTYLLSPQRELLEVFNVQVKHPVMAKVLNKHLNAP